MNQTDLKFFEKLPTPDQVAKIVALEKLVVDLNEAQIGLGPKTTAEIIEIIATAQNFIEKLNQGQDLLSNESAEMLFKKYNEVISLDVGE